MGTKKKASRTNVNPNVVSTACQEDLDNATLNNAEL